MVFDLRELEGEDLRPQPLLERRQALEQLVADRQLIIPTRRPVANGLDERQGRLPRAAHGSRPLNR